jgi:type VI secretion system protein ImpH
MAAENGRESPGLSEELRQRPARFDFFQAVRLLERQARAQAQEDPAGPRQPVGQDWAPRQEAVRFRALPSLNFPAGAVSRIDEPAPADGVTAPPEMVVSFLGLTGPQGVLPAHYTTLLMRRIRDKDYALRDFLDLFNHRLISLFFRAGEKYRLPVTYERARLGPGGSGADPASTALYCLAGMGTVGLRGRLTVDDEAFLYYSGHFAHYPRSALALECLLADYFGLALRVLQAQGQWLTLDVADQGRLPGPGLPEGPHQLGVDVIAGERVWDIQSKFRLRIGPLSYAEFRRFMPDGEGLRSLCELTRAFVGPELDFDVQPVLRAAEVPWCQLSAAGADRPCLGWNTWVRCAPFAQDVDSAVFFLDGV